MKIENWDYDRWPNFRRSEFACRCGCGFDDIAPETVDVLQWLRNYYRRAVTVTSACRCEAHNKAEGGGRRSQHLLGTAADISVSGIAAATVYGDIDRAYPATLGLGRYIRQSFTHVDTRPGRARWDG